VFLADLLLWHSKRALTSKIRLRQCVFYLLSLFIFSVALFRGKASAQVLTPPQLASAGPVLDDLFRRSGSTGMIVVVVRGQETWMQGYGQTRPGSHETPDGQSLVRLCSLTKIMTTDLLVKMIADGRVSLTDPLQKFAPRNVIVPTLSVRGERGRPITLGDLATHTAGLPREIAYPLGDAGHFTFPDYNFRWQWLPGFRLRTVPGTAAHYSNIGFDLLGDALASAAGEPFPRLFEERIARPLGLRNTTLTPTAAECARLLIGAKSEGQCADTTASESSGGMYSTANDMTLWLKYLLDLPGVPVHQSAAATAVYIPVTQLRWTQGMNHAGAPEGIGLGWVDLNAPGDPAAIIEKTGGGAGYTTYIALNRAHHIGVFVAATEGRHAGADIFRETNDLLLYLAGLSPVPRDPVLLVGADHRAPVSIRKTVLHRHRRAAGRRRITRQHAHASVAAAAR
jgi:D-alanyl-D-alanine-carboxypeptidase/D-alanyl-D-alanine-endopeptidase